MSCTTSCDGASPGCLGMRGFLERSLVGLTSGAAAWPFEPLVVVVSVVAVWVSAVVSAEACVVPPADGMSAVFVSLPPQPATATRSASRARSEPFRRISRGRLARLAGMRAGEGTRTPGLLITNQLLYQLSYSGARRTLPSADGR